jgi:ribosomal protein S18 acetylase RimI-like enzyme
VARNPEGFLVAEDETGLIGTVIGTFDGRRGWIYKLCSRDDRRGIGLGRALMERIQEILARQGCRKVNLLVDHGNQGVIAFYEKLGFRAHSDIMLDRFLHIPERDEGFSG